MKHIFVLDESDKDFLFNTSIINDTKEKIIEKCNKYNIKPEFLTKGRGDEKLISGIISNNIWKCDDECIVYSVGSDAILNCVVNGIIGTNAILGVIPTKNNNFFKTISNNNKNILDRTIHSAIDKEPTLDIDVGILNNRYFINSVVFGYYAQLLTDKFKKSKDKISYLNKIKTLLNYKSNDLHISSEDILLQDNILLMAIMNGHFVDRNLHLSNNAILNDGYFDVIIARDMQDRFGLIRNISNGISYTQKVDKDALVYLLKEDSIIIEAPRRILCDVDGIIFNGRTFDISISKNEVRVLLPKTK
jgi:diacylglycerol kinase family enzyme